MVYIDCIKVQASINDELNGLIDMASSQTYGTHCFALVDHLKQIKDRVNDVINREPPCFCFTKISDDANSKPTPDGNFIVVCTSEGDFHICQYVFDYKLEQYVYRTKFGDIVKDVVCWTTLFDVPDCVIKREPEELVPVGSQWRHFKGFDIVVICTLLNTTTQETDVVYDGIDGDKYCGRYSIPITEFVKKVDREKYPESTQEFIFERI